MATHAVNVIMPIHRQEADVCDGHPGRLVQECGMECAYDVEWTESE